METSVKVGLFLTLLVAFLAVYYKNNNSFENDLNSKMDKVLKSLLRHEKSTSVLPRTKVAIGYGGCLDLFVEGRHFFNSDSEFSKPPEKPRHYKRIRSWKQLREIYAYFFQNGAAAERLVNDEDLFKEMVERAKNSPNSRWALGGNAPVMAQRFAEEGAEVLLSAKMTSELRKSLHKDVILPGDEVEVDDVHLIIEYKRDEKWGRYKSPRANRFIIHSDNNNPTISSLEDFDEKLRGYQPNLFLVGGLQMMDGYPFPKGLREERLKKIRDQMSSQQLSKTRIHFEMASFVDESLLVDLSRYVIPFADSLGMNEQELPNLQSILTHGNVSLVVDSNPRIAIVLDQMREVFGILSETREVQGQRKLTRLHVHTLAYQVIMIKRGSPWKNLKAAAAKASLTANRHVCASKWVDLSKAFIIMDESFSTSTTKPPSRILFDDERPVSCWTEAELDVEICLAPNLVCSEAKQTAGGGDNISAAGLVLQV